MSKPIDQELLPCPFCGGVPIVSSFPGLNKIYCSNQPVKCGNRSMFTRDEWQARSAVQPAGVAVPEAEWVMHLLADRWPESAERVEVELFAEWLREVLAAAPHPVSGEQNAGSSEAYDYLDRVLRGYLDDEDYAEAIGNLDLLYAAPPAAQDVSGLCELIDDVCEWFELSGLHDVKEYKLLKEAHRAQAQVGDE